MFHVPEKFRITNPSHALASNKWFGNNGAFVIPHPKIEKYFISTIASDGMNWEHVSVSIFSTIRKVERCPTWEEMCFVKNLFWDGNDAVIQFHPPESEYINNHDYCLHLWRPINQAVPLPEKIMI